MNGGRWLVRVVVRGKSLGHFRCPLLMIHINTYFYCYYVMRQTADNECVNVSMNVHPIIRSLLVHFISFLVLFVFRLSNLCVCLSVSMAVIYIWYVLP
jgi:hypothetical protein